MAGKGGDGAHGAHGAHVAHGLGKFEMFQVEMLKKMVGEWVNDADVVFEPWALDDMLGTWGVFRNGVNRTFATRGEVGNRMENVGNLF